MEMNAHQVLNTKRLCQYKGWSYHHDPAGWMIDGGRIVDERTSREFIFFKNLFTYDETVRGVLNQFDRDGLRNELEASLDIRTDRWESGYYLDGDTIGRAVLSVLDDHAPDEIPPGFVPHVLECYAADHEALASGPPVELSGRDDPAWAVGSANSQTVVVRDTGVELHRVRDDGRPADASYDRTEDGVDTLLNDAVAAVCSADSEPTGLSM